MEIVCKNVGELFQVQTEDHRNDAMEDLSHAFWQLLQTTGMKLMLTKAQIRSDIQIKVRSTLGLVMVLVVTFRLKKIFQSSKDSKRQKEILLQLLRSYPLTNL